MTRPGMWRTKLHAIVTLVFYLLAAVGMWVAVAFAFGLF